MVGFKIDENNWVRCAKCGHKLFKIKGNMPDFENKNMLETLGLEIKCHSCKEINYIYNTNNRG